MTNQNLTKSIKDTRELVELHGTQVATLDEAEDNPLLALTEMQRRFVEAYAALAGSHGSLKKSAEYAGYAEGTCAVKGSTLIRMPKILAALRYLTEHKAHASAIIAMSTLEHLMINGNDSIRLKASERILGYAGIILKTVHQHEHNVTDNRTADQIRLGLAEKAAKLGINMIDITPGKRQSNNPEGGPRWKRQLSPNRPLTEAEEEDIDWINLEVNK